MKKTIIRIIISIITGLALSGLSLLVESPSNCPVGIDTCGINAGLPLTVLEGPSYARVFRPEIFAMNTLFWVFISLIVIALLIPFVKENILQKTKQRP